jgi:hypothetical protein
VRPAILALGCALALLPAIPAGALNATDVHYYYHGHPYRYHWHGGYYNYRWHGHYYRWRYHCAVGWCYR